MFLAHLTAPSYMSGFGFRLSKESKAPGLGSRPVFAGKESKRFPEKWAYFGFIGDDGKALAQAEPFRKEACWKCHNENAAVDNVFVQFYPILREAQAKKDNPWTRRRWMARPVRTSPPKNRKAELTLGLIGRRALRLLACASLSKQETEPHEHRDSRPHDQQADRHRPEEVKGCMASVIHKYVYTSLAGLRWFKARSLMIRRHIGDATVHTIPAPFFKFSTLYEVA